MMDSEHNREFFQECYKFLCQKYGSKNVITADVHEDESTPHMHFTFVPVVANTRKYKDPNKKPRFSEKVCAEKLITREHLQKFHEELKSWFLDKGLDWGKYVVTGKTTYNRSIAELKHKTEVECYSVHAEVRNTIEKAKEDAKAIVYKQQELLDNLEC